ncbi:MAG: site-specific integrase [Pseudomonadota bacterium]
MDTDKIPISDPKREDENPPPTGNIPGKAMNPANRTAKSKTQYSPKTKRRATRYAGVYTREAERIRGVMDVCFDISYKQDGKKVWEKVGWESHGFSGKLADQIRSERIRNILHGDVLPKKKKKAPLFKEAAGKYLEWAEENKTRKGIDDKRRYDFHLSKRFDGKHLDEISSFDLERLKADLLKKELAPATVKHCLVIVRQIYNKAAIWGLHKGENPVIGVKMPVLQNRRERFLSHSEAQTILKALKVKSERLHDMALLSLHCGLRAGEVFNIRGQDIDFENGLINISDPKNKISRKAFMTTAVREMLKARPVKSPDDFLFMNKRGSREIKDAPHKRGDGKLKDVSQTFRRVINDLKLNAGIEDRRQKITFHTLRHTFASWLALQGETTLTIKELLGHKTLAMAERYSHLIPDHKRRAILAMEKGFSNPENGMIASEESEKVQGK